LPFNPFLTELSVSDQICRHCFVAGRVQGVFYRASTKEQALRLGIKGHARNLADGRVEVLAVGTAMAVETLIQWLHSGPPAANVTRVDVQEIALNDADVPPGFTTR
jgi:acylphosphatase